MKLCLDKQRLFLKPEQIEKEFLDPLDCGSGSMAFLKKCPALSRLEHPGLGFLFPSSFGRTFSVGVP